MEVRAIHLDAGRTDEPAERRTMAEQAAARRSGCSRRCSIGSPTTSPTRSASRASTACCRKGACGKSVLRDLAWLFNATQLEAVDAICDAPYVRALGGEFRTAGAVRQGGVVARHRRSRPERSAKRSSHFEPRILPATLRDPDAARGGRSRSPQRDRRRDPRRSCGRSRCRSNSWSAPNSISRPERCASPISSRRRGWRDGSAPAAVLQPRTAASARDGRGVRRAVSEDRGPARDARPRGGRPVRRAAARRRRHFSRRACSSSSTPSFRASRRRCSRSSIRTTWRRRRRCSVAQLTPTPTIPNLATGRVRARGSTMSRRWQPRTTRRRANFGPRRT